MGKRKELRKHLGARLGVTATVARFGIKNGYKGPEPTILLKNVQDADGNTLTDHLWFKKGKSWDAAQPGCKVSFSARVDSYVKGYQGHRWDVERTQETDYRLVYPTKVQVTQAEKEVA
ncbi:hypothetical protein SAMN05421853_11098 [Roseivivax halotolerans]|uniref:Single-stranded DNA-binding protein n=1 Tax=Roseivivax halotolerans TaxID=93684 RepID=A0A1I5ZJC6_9RHOB|nr:hypothetical protein [Roseivivax halotolerans]SFQ56558.1 hypothetical protein SAMN05421853_11098 [Roseivivax halotolerans]